MQPLREASVENPMQTDVGGSSQEQPVEHTENSPRQGEKLRGRVLPKSVQASFASSLEPAASKASPMSLPATSTNSNSREGPSELHFFHLVFCVHLGHLETCRLAGFFVATHETRSKPSNASFSVLQTRARYKLTRGPCVG